VIKPSFCLAALLMLSAPLWGSVDFSLSSEFIEKPIYYNVNNESLLNPNNEILTLDRTINKIYAKVAAKATLSSKLSFVIKGRPTLLGSSHDTTTQIVIDDGYADISAYQNLFLYLGKKNVWNGVGLSYNPTDFFGEGKPIDRTLTEEERRTEREGDCLAGTDILFNGGMLSLIFAPSIKEVQAQNNRFLLKSDFLLEDIKTDISLLYFNSSISGLGMDVSTTVNDKCVLYTDSAIRWGGTRRKAIKLVQDGSPRIYEITTPDDSQRPYLCSLLGGQYTFDNNVNVIVEYIYNGDGYNNTEWDNVINFIQYGAEEYKLGVAPELMKLNLLQTNNFMDIGKIRQHYGFIRISKADLWENINISLVGYCSLDDQSFLINPTIDCSLGQNSLIGLTATFFFGNNRSEFGLTQWNYEIAVAYKWFAL
jgi:hypothetical protein